MSGDHLPAVIDAAYLAHQRKWSTDTFGPGLRLGVIDHIRKELVEVEDDPSDLAEWVDVIILGFDGAWRAGHEPQAILDAVAAKQAKNEAREWPDWRIADRDKAIEHQRSQPLCQAMVDMGERHGLVRCLWPMPCSAHLHRTTEGWVYSSRSPQTRQFADGVGPHPSATGTGDAGRVPDRVTGPGNGPEAA